jgi:hypothetical protein
MPNSKLEILAFSKSGDFYSLLVASLKDSTISRGVTVRIIRQVGSDPDNVYIDKSSDIGTIEIQDADIPNSEIKDALLIID